MNNNVCRAKLVRAAEADFDQACKDFNFFPQIIKGKARYKPYHTHRCQIARRLYAKGHSTPTIGIVMERDHASILGMVNDKVRSKRNARSKKAYQERKS